MKGKPEILNVSSLHEEFLLFLWWKLSSFFLKICNQICLLMNKIFCILNTVILFDIIFKILSVCSSFITWLQRVSCYVCQPVCTMIFLPSTWYFFSKWLCSAVVHNLPLIMLIGGVFLPLYSFMFCPKCRLLSVGTVVLLICET